MTNMSTNRSPLSFLLPLSVLSVPCWVLGSIYDVRIFPGFNLYQLPLALSSVTAVILIYREGGKSGVVALLKRTYDGGDHPAARCGRRRHVVEGMPECRRQHAPVGPVRAARQDDGSRADSETEPADDHGNGHGSVGFHDEECRRVPHIAWLAGNCPRRRADPKSNVANEGRSIGRRATASVTAPARNTARSTQMSRMLARRSLHLSGMRISPIDDPPFPDDQVDVTKSLNVGKRIAIEKDTLRPTPTCALWAHIVLF